MRRATLQSAYCATTADPASFAACLARIRRICARAAAILTAQHVTGAPEIVIEIGSPGTRKRDETIKRRPYERCGVSGYWVVDPDLDVVRVYRRQEGRFGRRTELAAEADDVLTTALLPGLEIPLSRVFA
jgi:Uma2 family endonuclease